MAPKDKISPYEALLLERIPEVIAELEATASTGKLLERLSDQPFATRAVLGADGRTGDVPVFMGLELGAPPSRIGRGWLISSVALSSAAISLELPTQESGTLDRTEEPQGLLPIEAVRAPLLEARQMIEDVVRFERDGDAAARKRVEERVRPKWERTVVMLPEFSSDSGARAWTTGAEGAVAHAGRAMLRDPGLRLRLRLCPRCGGVLFTPPGPGPIRDACVGCNPAGIARDSRKRLGEALRDAGCPKPDVVAALALRQGLQTIVELRCAGSTAWLREAVERELGRARRGMTDREMLDEVASIQRRLATAPLRGRAGELGWGVRAFDELQLTHAGQAIPTEAQIRRAGEVFARKFSTLGTPESRAYPRQVLDDALAFRRVLCGRTRSPG